MQAQGRSADKGLFRGVGVTDHRDVRLGVEQVCQATSYDLVVGQQEHADRVRSVKVRVSDMMTPWSLGTGQTVSCPRSRSSPAGAERTRADETSLTR